MEYSSITTKGQITIPVRIRKALGLKAGGKVAFQIEGNAVKLVPMLDDVTAAFGLLKSGKSVTLEEMDQAIEQEAVSRYNETTQRS